MKIQSDIYDIHETGSVISINKKPINFIFEGLTVTFIFEDADTGQKNKFRAETSPNKPNWLNLIFSNCNESLGVGNTVPILIGWVNDRSLYLNYRIYSLTAGLDKLIHYTWYLGESRNAK